jgi:hypothetical protein
MFRSRESALPVVRCRAIVVPPYSIDKQLRGTDKGIGKLTGFTGLTGLQTIQPDPFGSSARQMKRVIEIRPFQCPNNGWIDSVDVGAAAVEIP